MEKKVAEKAFRSAEKDLKKEKIEKYKKMVLETLEKLESKKKVRQKLDKEIQVLKRDIDDLKAGRLDKIEERQRKDKIAKETSVVKVIPVITDKDSANLTGAFDVYTTYGNTTVTCGDSLAISAYDARYNTPGTYTLSDGSIKSI